MRLRVGFAHSTIVVDLVNRALNRVPATELAVVVDVSGEFEIAATLMGVIVDESNEMVIVAVACAKSAQILLVTVHVLIVLLCGLCVNHVARHVNRLVMLREGRVAID